MKILITIILVATALNSYAADGYISGVGVESCGDILAAVNNHDIDEERLESWTQGYFSGANIAYGLRSKSGDVNTGSTVLPSRLMALVKQKCEAKIDYAYAKAVDEVYFELRVAGQ
ncbi:MAG: hypothetical protein ACAH12_04980 [Methylophilaceae bacterium]|uniref:hypothetical protein n=1 Tax=Methylovorus sp. MM2 TaxID=1848038 RepID=UPI0007DE89A8|nr:hypothetical protein [Methylovorus sp. MM2]OAM52368.1 hypothetical protein A7981_02480 [Methylovorus sp. MM2]